MPQAGNAAAGALKAVLAGAFVVTMALRLLPISYGAPQPGYFSSDEIDAVSRALKMATGDLMPIHANKPTLYNAVLAGCYGTQFLVAKIVRGAQREDFERAFFVTPFGFYRIARCVSIASSIGALLLMVLLLKKHPPGARLLGLVLLGMAPSSTYYGHVAKEDALAALLAFASFGCAVKALGQRRGGEALLSTRGWICASALSAGLAVSTKYNCFFCVGFPLIACWIEAPPGLQRARQTGSVIALTAMAFVAGTPYALLHPLSFIERTLGSAVASQVTGSYNILSYAGNRGPAFALAILWREFGVALPVIGVGLVCVATRRDTTRWLLLAPTLLYLATLCVSSQLDYQYVMVVSPVVVYAVAEGWSACRDRIGPTPAAVRSLVLAGVMLVVLACASHLLRLTRQTAEFLGGDTRLVAGSWIAGQLAQGRLSGKPLLIASGYYYHYHPAMCFDAATYQELRDYARSTGTGGDYFSKALKYAGETTGTCVTATFLDIRTGFRRLRDGSLEFEPQPFSLRMDDYRGRHSLVVLPSSALRLNERPVPELEQLQRLIRQFAELPVVRSFQPVPWKLAGPPVLIVEAP